MTHTLGTIEASVIGVKLKDGVILAGTKNIAYGHIVISQAGKNVAILDKVGFAFAGHVSDLQTLLKEIQFEIRYLKYQLDRPLSLHAIANRLGLILYSMKFFPYITFALVGGIDEVKGDKPILFSLDPVGSVMEEDYAASGTSVEIAMGILEDRYRRDMTIEEGRNLVLDVMKAIARRDVYAGRYIDIALISKEKAEIETIKLDI